LRAAGDVREVPDDWTPTSHRCASQVGKNTSYKGYGWLGPRSKRSSYSAYVLLITLCCPIHGRFVGSTTAIDRRPEPLSFYPCCRVRTSQDRCEVTGQYQVHINVQTNSGFAQVSCRPMQLSAMPTELTEADTTGALNDVMTALQVDMDFPYTG